MAASAACRRQRGRAVALEPPVTDHLTPVVGPQHRKWLLVAVVSMAFGVVFTLVYIYPINEVLFAQAGGSHSPEEVRALVRQWVTADRARFGVGAIGFLALLRALSLPFPQQSRS